MEKCINRFIDKQCLKVADSFQSNNELSALLGLDEEILWLRRYIKLGPKKFKKKYKIKGLV